MREYYTSFYNSSAWRKLRALYIKRQPICEHCKTFDIATPADVVDHVIELQDDYERRLDIKNLQSLCHACHNLKTAQERIRRDKEMMSAANTMRSVMDVKEMIRIARANK